MADFNELLRRAANRPNKEKVAFEEGLNRNTFTEMWEAVDGAAEWLKQNDCKKWDCVAALTDNRIETVALEWAAYRKGCVWIGIPAREREFGNFQQILTEFRPKVLLFESAAVDPAYSGVLDRLPRYQNEIMPPGIFARDKYRALKRDDLNDSEPFKACAKENQIVRVRYTSGAGGQPKAILYSEQTRLAIMDQIGSKLDQLSEKDGCSQVGTMIHVAPIVWATGSLIAPVFCRGGNNVFLARWDLTEFVQTVAAHRSERVLTFLTPGILDALAAYSERCGAGWAENPREFRIMVAGSPLPVPTMRRVQRALPVKNTKFFVTLGQTEASFPITWHEVSSKDLDPKKGSKTPWFVPLGPLEPCYRHKSRIRRQELQLSGNAVAPGRWEKSTEESREESRFKSLSQPVPTGDLVVEERKNRKKVLHYRGRKGLAPPDQPPPEAIEAIINQCPGVHRSRLDYCLHGEGNLSILTVEIRGSGVEVTELRRWLRDRLEEEKLPDFVFGHVRYGNVPLTMSGKILRDQSLTEALCKEYSNRPSAPSNPNFPGTGGKGCIDWPNFSFSELESGPLYFYVGAGLSKAAGLVDWEEMACLIWWFRKHYEKRDPGVCPLRKRTLEAAQENAKYLQEFIDEKERGDDAKEGSLDSPPILSRKSTTDEALGRTALLNLMLRYRRPRMSLMSDSKGKAVPEQPPVFRQRPGTEPSTEDLRLQSLIWRSRCHGVLTTNYDMLLEHAYSLYDHGAALRSYRYSAGFLRYLLSNPRFVLKLHGDINDIATMEFDPWSAWDNRQRLGGEAGEQLKQVYNAALRRGHMVYIGCSFRDRTIHELHNGKGRRPAEPWSKDKKARRNCRVALVPEENCKGLPAKYPGIQFLTHRRKQYQEVGGFLESIVAARSGMHDVWQACPEASDIHRQLFLAPEEDLKLQKNLSTESWSCMVKSNDPDKGR